jgi:hypothetical protein
MFGSLASPNLMLAVRLRLPPSLAASILPEALNSALETEIGLFTSLKTITSRSSNG